jgi:dienelactone hydrolase
MKFSREDVEFTSRGAPLRGWLYRPDGQSSAPGIVMAHGFTAVREMFLDRYAEAFATAGFATLVYDHFGFGASGGEPRQSPTPSWQMEGYRDAVNWMRRRAGINADRIGIWGSSYSGGQVVILASEDLPIRCAVAQVPGFGGETLHLSAATVGAIGDAFEKGRLDELIPAASASADGVGIMYPDDSYGWFTRVSRERAPSWRNEVRIGALAEPFNPIEFLASARTPLRILVAPDDKLTPPQAGMKVASTIPMIDVVQIAGGHFDAYESGFAESSRHALDWFARHFNA